MRELNVQDLHACVRRTPNKLKKMMMNHGSKIVVAGGFARSIITGERISDIDCFAGDKDTSEIFATELHGSNGFHKTDNAFTITNIKPKVQFIFRWTFEQNSPKLIIYSFDFSICQAAFWFDLQFERWRSVCGNSFYEDLAAKRLVYLSPERNEDAGGSILRVLKYYQRGYRIPLDSLGAVIARLLSGVEESKMWDDNEYRRAAVLTGLLYEVDPNAVIDHRAYLPIMDEGKEDDAKVDMG